MTSALTIGVASKMPRGSDSRLGPGQKDMWYFVLFDSFIFSCYLVSYVIFRAKYPAAFIESQAHLNKGFGIFNTILLLTSSLFLAQCVKYTKDDQRSRARGFLILTAVTGISFMVSKSVEWSLAIAQGFTLTSSLFFTFYYFITGFHMVHMACGLVALSYAYGNLRNPGDRVVYTVETGATYWHMVDLLWVYIFALLYLMR